MQKKKVDIAIFLDIESEASDVVALYKALRQYIEESLMNDPWTGSMIPFSIIDVQLDRVEESKVRMMTAAGSILKYLRYLLDERTSLSDMKPDVHASLLQRLPPVLGWMVRGHEWKFHVCYRSDKDRLVSLSASIAVVSECGTNTIARYGLRCLWAMGARAQRRVPSAFFVLSKRLRRTLDRNMWRG